jgi:hypothetical protein
MPKVHNIGEDMYIHTMKYPSRKFPLTERGHTQEIESPYREGQGRVVRFPFSRQAVVMGRWQTSREEDAALTDAIGMRELGEYVPN